MQNLEQFGGDRFRRVVDQRVLSILVRPCFVGPSVSVYGVPEEHSFGPRPVSHDQDRSVLDHESPIISELMTKVGRQEFGCPPEQLGISLHRSSIDRNSSSATDIAKRPDLPLSERERHAVLR